MRDDDDDDDDDGDDDDDDEDKKPPKSSGCGCVNCNKNLQSVVVVVPQLVQQSPIRREAGVNIPQEKSTWIKFIRDRLWKILMN